MGIFDKIKVGLTKTREALGNTLGSVFSGFSEIDDYFYDELEESLILADLGVETAVKAADRLRKTVREQHLKTTDEAKTALKGILVDMLSVGASALELNTKPSVILVIGVNGVGKTTTIGKIAAQLTKQGKNVLLVAGDTFRGCCGPTGGLGAACRGILGAAARRCRSGVCCVRWDPVCKSQRGRCDHRGYCRKTS